MSAQYESNMKRLLEHEAACELRIKKAEEEAQTIKDQASIKAKAEIDILREQRNKEFDSKKVDHTTEYADLKKTTEEKIAVDADLFAKNKDAVIDMLVDRIMFVRHELPQNVKRDYTVFKQQ